MTTGRQPISTLYGGAHLYRQGSAQKLGELAKRALEQVAKDGPSLRRVAPWLVKHSDETLQRAYERTLTKLVNEPIEDQRIDFEDGFGPRADEEEDREAVRTAKEVAQGAANGALPPFLGIRVRPFGGSTRARAERTLSLFFETLESTLALPTKLPKFLVTLPKVEALSEVVDFTHTVARTRGASEVLLELMIETPSALLDDVGRCPLPSFIDALGERAFALHLGAYDLTSELGVLAPSQSLAHPACEQARFWMLTASRGRVNVVDGATTHLPLGDEPGVREGWRLHGDNVLAALHQGIYQGWDLHPAQLPIRYIALYTYFLAARDAMAARLSAFLGKAAQATRVGALFDDAATGRALVGFFRRGFECGAFDLADLAKANLDATSVMRGWDELVRGC